MHGSGQEGWSNTWRVTFLRTLHLEIAGGWPPRIFCCIGGAKVCRYRQIPAPRCRYRQIQAPPNLAVAAPGSSRRSKKLAVAAPGSSRWSKMA